MLRCSRRLLSIFAVAVSFASVHAAELGEVRLSSHIGQPLVADIELAMIDDPAQPVSVRLASPEVYNGAGIAMPPVLASLNLSVMRRDGRQFLHVTSLRPVDAEHLHLYLELSDKGQRAVRLATLWLTPDPNPAPQPVAPAPVYKPEARKAEPAPALLAQAAPPAAPQPLPKPAPEPAPKPAPAAPAPQPVHAHRAAPPAAPAACERQAEQAKICAALDGKNAVLKEQIGSLEGKVKSLQASLGVAPAAATLAAAPAAPAAHAPAGPKPISAIKPLAPRKPRAAPPEPDAGLQWGWIGAGAALLLALGGALLMLRRRGRAVRNVDIPAGPRLIDRLRGSLPARSKPGAPEAAEPGFD